MPATRERASLKYVVLKAGGSSRIVRSTDRDGGRDIVPASLLQAL